MRDVDIVPSYMRKRRKADLKCFSSFINTLECDSFIFDILKGVEGYSVKNVAANRLRLRAYYDVMKSAKSEGEGREIIELSELYGVFKGDFAVRLQNAVEAGGVLDKSDVDLGRVIRDLLVEKHKLKFGEKSFQVQAKLSYKDFMGEVLKGE